MFVCFTEITLLLVICSILSPFLHRDVLMMFGSFVWLFFFVVCNLVLKFRSTPCPDKKRVYDIFDISLANLNVFS